MHPKYDLEMPETNIFFICYKALTYSASCHCGRYASSLRSENSEENLPMTTLLSTEIVFSAKAADKRTGAVFTL